MSKGESNVERRMEKKPDIEGVQLTSMLYKFQGAQLIQRDSAAQFQIGITRWLDCLDGLHEEFRDR